MRRRVGLVIVLAALAVPGSAHAVQAPAFADADKLDVVAVKQLSPRLLELRLATPLLTAPTNVQILLPDEYDAQPARRFPVLYLFHGTSGGARDWTKAGDAEQTTAGQPLIVVMPDAGVESDGGSWFTDWVNGGRYGPPMWETWHIRHLLPWIDSQLRTVADRGGRAIAGLSQGGFGAMSYAARHPDLFGAAASFSGALDISANPEIAVPLTTPIINATEVFLNGDPPNTIFGDRVTNAINWAAHDPATLAGNLRATSLYAYTGNGAPQADLIEAGAHQLTTLFVGELRERNIPIDFQDYGPGTHTWPYWERDLRDVLPKLMRDFARPAPPPVVIDHESADDHFSAWGWDVVMRRPQREFAALLRAGADGFSLRGSGSATVTTPARYAPGAQATVDDRPATVDERGRLRIEVARVPARVRIDAPPCPATVRVRFKGRVRSARATTGRRTLRTRRSARTVTASLAGLPAGAHTVRFVVRMRSGQRRILRRAIRLC